MASSPQARAPMALPYGGSNQYYNGGGNAAPMPGNSNPFGGGGASASPYFNGGMTFNPYDPNSNPYQVPMQGGTGPGQPGYYPWGTADPGYGGAAKQGRTTNPGSENIGHGIIATGLQYGGLSQDFANYLQSQIGTGVTPFDLSTMLPGGGMTQPGQLTAGLNPILSQLQNFFSTGQAGGIPGLQGLQNFASGNFSGIPGISQLQNIGQNGISALPEWQSMIAAQQQNIQQNEANLKEQFGSTGNLAGSPYGTGLSNYLSQTTADQNALLGQLQQQNILQGQLPALQNLAGLTSGLQSSAGQFLGNAATQFGGGLQSLNQQAIQNMFQEFQRVSPQNNPLMQYIGGLSTLYPPTTKTPTGFDQFTSLLSSLSGSGFSSGGGGGTQIGF